MKWNQQQLQAIQTVDKNILVSASAGAGKTTVLVARLMKRILEDSVSVDQILAMTFTEAAAAEMKKRLLSSLHKEYQSNPSDYLKKQIALIPNASISTIHSFCLSILKNYYYVLPLDPERLDNILDDGTQAIYQEEALNKVLQKEIEKNDSAFQNLNLLFSAKPIDYQGLKLSIKKLATTALSQIDYSTWLEQAISIYQEYKQMKELPEPLQTYLWDSYRLICTKYQSQLEDLLLHVEQHYPTHTEIINEIQLKYEKANYLLECIDLKEYSLFVRSFCNQALEELPKNPDRSDTTYGQLRTDFQKYVQSIVTILFDESLLLSDITALKVPLGKLVQLTKDYILEFQQIKETNLCIDFNDMELFAYQILIKNNNQVAEELKVQYIDILVDEFQDSNPIQDTLVSLISRGNNVFRVGDIKQSIYRFRGAKPSIMRSLIQNRNESDQLIYLNYNYRSKQSIVQFNNELFDTLMNLEGLSDQYSSEDYVSTGISAQEENCIPVEFHLIDKENLFTEDQQEKDLKATYIASKIIDLYQASENPKWSDYVVLVRSHQLKINLKKAFEQANIPHFISMPSGFYQSPSVSTILSYCQLLLNPKDDISFVSVLLHLYHYTDEEIANIAITKEDSNYYQFFLNQNHPIVETLHHLQEKMKYLSVTELLSSIYQLEDFYELFCDKQQRTNLDLLYEKASSYQNGSSSLLDFIDYVSKITDEKTSEAISISSEDNVVRVMTIHQSKGLQFPTVLFWSNFRQDIQDEKEFLITDELLGIGVHSLELPNRYRRMNLIRKAISYKNQKEELEEQIRVLYVALTRAQNHMILVDAFSKTPSTSEMKYTHLFDLIGYSGWLYKIFNTIESDSFEIKIIQHVEAKTLPKQLEQVEMKLSRYNKPSVIKDFISPSSTEEFLPNPTLHFGTVHGSDIGTQLHKVIEQLPNTQWTQEDILQVEPKIKTGYLEALLNFSQSSIYQQALTMTIEKELSFAVNLDNSLLHGYIDFVAYDQSSCILIDFKTDSLETPEEFIQRYSSQIMLYQQALAVLYPNRIIECYIYSFYLEEFISIKNISNN